MIIREGYEAGYRQLHITGGEPLLWDGLPGVFEKAFALGYESAFLNTNGTLLTRELSRELAMQGGLAVSISLQGPRRLHDRIRGKGSYDRALKGIDHALSAGLPVHVFTAVGRSLLPDLPRFAGGLFEAFPGIEQFTLIQLIRVPNDDFDLSGEVLRPEDFIRLVRIVSLLNLFGLGVSLLNNPLATVVSTVLKMPWLPPSLSLYRPGSMMITADLDVTVSHSTTERCGVYEPGAIRRILGSKEYRRTASPDQGTCPKCIHFPLCRRAGMMRPSEWCRDMCPEVPYCKRVLAKASSYG